MEPSEKNYKIREVKEEKLESSEKYGTDNYGEENYKTSYDDEEKLIRLLEPNSKLAPPGKLDTSEAPPDYCKKSESHRPISPWKKALFFLVLISAGAFFTCMGVVCGDASMALKHHGNTKAVSDEIPFHEVSHEVEGMALGEEYRGHSDLEDHFEDHHDLKGHDELEGRDESQFRPAYLSIDNFTFFAFLFVIMFLIGTVVFIFFT